LTIEIKDRQIEEFRKLQEDQKQRREQIVKGDWTGQGKLLNALRSAIASEQEKERDEINKRHGEELEKVKVAPFPDFDQWQQQRAEVDRVEIVRVEQERESKQERGQGLSM
jgi:hypothetical protein